MRLTYRITADFTQQTEILIIVGDAEEKPQAMRCNQLRLQYRAGGTLVLWRSEFGVRDRWYVDVCGIPFDPDELNLYVQTRVLEPISTDIGVRKLPRPK